MVSSSSEKYTRKMGAFFFFLCFIHIKPVRSFFEGSCPRKDPPPGVVVLAPGSSLLLSCSGLVKVNREKVTTGSHPLNKRTTSNKIPTLKTQMSNCAASTKSQKTSAQTMEQQSNTSAEEAPSSSSTTSSNLTRPTAASGTTRDQTDLGTEKEDTSIDYELEDESSRVTKGIEWRAQWKWQKQLIRKEDQEKRGIQFCRGGETLNVPSVTLANAGKYTCHRGITEVFAVRIIVADPPEKPHLHCYKRSPKSKTRCEWKPQKPLQKQPNCYLYLHKRIEKSFKRISCSSQSSRCWCTLEHNDDHQRTLHTAFLCVTSEAGNATSPLLYFTPLIILKPDPPANISVRQEKGQERKIRVTWSLPRTWKQDNFYYIIYQLKYKPLMSSHEQVKDIKEERSFVISDALPGIDYKIQLRSKEEHDGSWSEWSAPVYARSWNETKTEATPTVVTLGADCELGTGDGLGCEWPGENDPKESPEDTCISSCFNFHHIFWIPALLLLLLLIIYIFRNKLKLISKLQRVWLFSQCHHSPQPTPSNPAAPEEKALVTLSPTLNNNLPSNETENGEVGTLTGGTDAIHFSNSSYFFLQREL